MVAPCKGAQRGWESSGNRSAAAAPDHPQVARWDRIWMEIGGSREPALIDAKPVDGQERSLE
jgi:hypothetical protein